MVLPAAAVVSGTSFCRDDQIGCSYDNMSGSGVDNNETFFLGVVRTMTTTTVRNVSCARRSEMGCIKCR